jgi:hypothetical protein
MTAEAVFSCFPELKELIADHLIGASQELCSKDESDNCFARLQSWWNDR